MSDRQQLADAFNRNIDPLKEYEQQFAAIDVDPFELFVQDVLDVENPARRTKKSYLLTVSQWSEYMDGEGRHPACPNENHVKGFVEEELHGRNNAVGTAKKKLYELNRIYQYWQNDAAFPHPADYNPFKIAKTKMSFSEENTKEPPRISIEKLRKHISGIKHIRDRALVVTQLKLGLRASEMANIKLGEISLQSGEAQRHYRGLGSSEFVEDYQNAVYIPHNRTKNKSQRPRVLPLDEEVRTLWMRYLLIRPDNGEPWLFLSHTSNSQMDDRAINEVWKRHFQPEYAETDRHKGVTSHFGRHRFTTYWIVEQGLNRELVQYMRGDTAGGGRSFRDSAAIDSYIHSYYEDIEPVYRSRMYRLDV